MSDGTRERRWPLPGDPDASVGTKQHLLPQLHQRYFGNEREMIATVVRATGERFVAPIKDTVAERNFYSTADETGKLDGKSDHLLGWAEAKVAPVIRELVHGGAFVRFPPAPAARADLCMFLAFQLTRGRYMRRMTEQAGDLYMHLMIPQGMDRGQAQAWLTARGEDPTDEAVEQVVAASAIMDKVEFMPDPNEHIRHMGPLALKLYPLLVFRHWYVAEYSVPSLITCDEPVVMIFDDPRRMGRRAGLADAAEVWFPLSPRHLLILADDGRYGAERRFAADPGSATEANLRIAANAYETIHMHPDQDHLAGIEIPEPGPLFRIVEPVEPELARRYGKAPARTRTRRR